MTAATLDAQTLDHLRTRTVRTLFSSVALGSTGHIAAVTVATVVAADLTGTSAWSGVPAAAVVLGSAAGSTILARFMAGHGRRLGLTAGYLISVIGAAIAAAGVIGHSFPLFLFGTVLIGFGNSSNQLSRYAAADMYEPSRRASALGLVVWGATVGAVLGPNLVAPAGTLAVTAGLPALAGAYLLPILFVGPAAILTFVWLRPDPYELADTSDTNLHELTPGTTSLEWLLRRPHVPVAIIALIAGMVVMVLVMTMTPLHMSQHGHDLGAIGLVISAHVFGMYALSPVSGRLTDRFGSQRVILAGLLILAGSAALSAVAPPEGGILLLLALFLLGFGWSLGYVAGSALLTVGLSLPERTRLQGLTDALIWSSAAAASLASGVVVAAAGYTTLGLLGAALVIIPAWLVHVRRAAIRGATG
jgi:MFS family permease